MHPQNNKKRVYLSIVPHNVSKCHTEERLIYGGNALRSSRIHGLTSVSNISRSDQALL